MTGVVNDRRALVVHEQPTAGRWQAEARAARTRRPSVSSAHAKTTAPAAVVARPPSAARQHAAPRRPRRCPARGCGPRPAAPSRGIPAVYTTYFRPDAFHTSLVASAMWMDTTLLNTDLVPGLQEPGGPNPWGGEVPLGQRAALVAAFNSGFTIGDSEGRLLQLRAGDPPARPRGGVVRHQHDGKGERRLWGRDFTMGPRIATVRQNLALLVDNGQLEPGLASDSNSKWGAHGRQQPVRLALRRRHRRPRRRSSTSPARGSAWSRWPSCSSGPARCGRWSSTSTATGSPPITYQQTDPNNPYAVNGVKLLPSHGAPRGPVSGPRRAGLLRPFRRPLTPAPARRAAAEPRPGGRCVTTW